ncbi:MAG TPA: helix-turn-helix transcriptional regulator [Stellaceae bacterium]|nr:helix-turn-helix transcriptional regulator [Stellaceae bacterium]
MDVFARHLRERARDLGLSDAEVARRAGLSERRYGYYVTGEREPNLATLVRICDVLGVTPNELLLPGGNKPLQSELARLTARIYAAAKGLSRGDLEIAACQLECLSARRHHAREPRAASRKRRRADNH